MTPIKQRIAIAEYLEYIDVREYVEDMDNDYLSLMGRKYRKGPLFRIPDYLNDLNAMHEAEKVLRNQFTLQEQQYWQLLSHIKPHPIYATAAQRAEAFLKTIGKWKE